MRIVVLLHYLRVAGGLSVGKNLARYLPECGKENQYLMTIPNGVGYEEILKDMPNVETLVIDDAKNILKRRYYDNFCLPKIIRKFQPDIIFGGGNVGLANPGCKQMILFHRPQLIYSFKFAKMGFAAKLWTLAIKRALSRCLKKTDIVFCQTPVTRKRFSDTFNYPIDQIKIMPNAVSGFSKESPEASDVPEVFKNKKTFDLFYLTKYYTHKNLEVLIDMFRNNKEQTKDIRCIVTVAPDQGLGAAEFLAAIEKYSLQDKIVNVGLLKQQELAGYFHNADALLFPTLLESFSGTYLEAMHFELPILTSDLDFARYVCDDAAVYFDPWNASDILEKICELKSSPDLQNDLVEKGKKRIESFFKTWEDIVSSVLEEMKNII